MNKKKIKHNNKLSDSQIYSIPEDRQLHNECKKCRCISCMWWASDCRTCALCLFEARPFTKCPHYEPFVFSVEPYSSYLKELDKNKDKLRMYID